MAPEGNSFTDDQDVHGGQPRKSKPAASPKNSEIQEIRWHQKSLPQARGEVGEKQLSLQLILGAFQVPNKQESVRYHSPADSDWRQQPVTAEDLFTGFLFMFVCIHWKPETDSNITHGLKKTSYLSLVLKNKTENRKHKKRISPLFYILSIVFFGIFALAVLHIILNV